MTFRFYDAELGGNEILVDEHAAAGSGAISVENGLFAVALGGGTVSDGAASLPGDPYTSLVQVFADFSEVWLQIEIRAPGGSVEVLSPRTRIHASPYSQNAHRLAGRLAGEFLDGSATPQTKAGDLTVNNMTLAGNSLYFAGGGHFVGGTKSTIHWGNDDKDYFRIYPGNSLSDGMFHIQGGGRIELRPAAGELLLANAATGGSTTLQIENNRLVCEDQLEVGGGSSTDDDFLYFDDSEFLKWSEADSRFQFSAPLKADRLQLGGLTEDPVMYNRVGIGTPNAGSEIFGSSDLLVSSDLEVGDMLYVMRSAVVGDTTPTQNQLFSSFGSTLSQEWSLISDVGDVFLAGDLEIDGYFNSTRWVGPTNYYTYQYTDASHIAVFDANDTSTTAYFAWNVHGNAVSNRIAKLEEDGDLRIGGALTEHAYSDIAESFLATEALEPGELVAIATARPDAVRRTHGADDGAVIGVVSTDPGVVLAGTPFHAGQLAEVWGDAIGAEYSAAIPKLRERVRVAYPEIDQSLAELAKEAEATEAADGAFAERRREIDENVESLALELFFSERFVPVALAGRVPVKVDASYGAIAAGDLLAPSPVPGVAMRASTPGPVVGTALEGLASGRGKILVFVGRSHFGGSSAATTVDHTEPAPLEPEAATASEPAAKEAAPFALASAPAATAVASELFRVDEHGNVYAKGSFNPASMDVAELFPVSEPVEAGDVLVIDAENPGRYSRSRSGPDAAVVGVVAAAPGVVLGRSLARIAAANRELGEELALARRIGDTEREAELWAALEAEFAKTHAPVALTGTVDVKVDAGYGSIRPGDLLVSSPTPGHAMVATDPTPGTVLGKALGAQETGTGTVRMLIMLR